MSHTPPIALSIGGSDCSAGAGIQADLKTFQSLGVYGLSAVSGVVAETQHEVRELEAVPVPLLQNQIHILLENYPIKAVKTGMLPTLHSVVAVAEIASMIKNKSIPIVVDPIAVASSGAPLSERGTAKLLCERLLPHATLVTPNLPEASAILKQEISTVDQMKNAARRISEKYHIACLLKGGHLPEKKELTDLLWHEGNAHIFTHQAFDFPEGIHGTGCALSAAIAAYLALGKALPDAVKCGISQVQKLIKNAHCWQGTDRKFIALGW